MSNWIKAFIGFGMIACSIPLASAHIEPFTTWYYPLVWYGLILFMDSLRAARGRPSLLFQRPMLFLCLLFWSATIWFMFEVFNFRLSNWYYIFASDHKAVRVVGSWLSFATVLPALYLIEKLLEDMHLFSKGPRFGLKLEGRQPALAALAGLACLILPLAWPRYAFPLIWAFGFLLPLPWFSKNLEATFLTDLTRSLPGRFLRLLTAGLICGLLWEGFNAFATIRWIYTVPFFQEIKLFEMPPLGFLGFPPFALECAVLYGVLAGLGWAPQLEGWGRPRQGRRGRPGSACAAGVMAVALGVAALEGMERYTIDSYTPRLESLELPEKANALLGRHGIEDCFSLRQALDHPAFIESFENAGGSASQTRRLVDLALLRGIGTENAKALERLGVHSVADLIGRNAYELAEALSEARRAGAPPVLPSRTRIWIHAASQAEP
ncbi:MAG: DUF4332 domain-containing protein [Planctomycetota bacterium]